MFNIELVERGADAQNHPADYFSVCWVFCFFCFLEEFRQEKTQTESI